MSSQEPTPAATVTQIAPGVRQVSVGAPFRSHVYLIDGPDGSDRLRRRHQGHRPGDPRRCGPAIVAGGGVAL